MDKISERYELNWDASPHVFILLFTQLCVAEGPWSSNINVNLWAESNRGCLLENAWALKDKHHLFAVYLRRDGIL